MNIFDLYFWQSFVSNLGATLIGVGLGIPIAIYISRWQERRTEMERKTKILSLLSEELEFDSSLIYEWNNNDDDIGSDDVSDCELSLFVRDDVWKAFADGGELQWIKDPNLLRNLSVAYFQVGVIKEISERLFSLTNTKFHSGRPNYIAESKKEIKKGAEEFLKTMNDLGKVLLKIISS